jgi:hypothetical protein
LERKKNAGQPIKFYNFWDQNLEDNWFRKFMINRNFHKKYPKLDISFFSVFGSGYTINLNQSKVKVFFTGENVRHLSYVRYNDHALNKKIDLALGFEYIKDDRYFRFPLWILFVFPPSLNEKGIKEKCDELSIYRPFKRDKFAALLASHDLNGLRGSIFEAMNSIEMVDCGGKFLHNNDDLWKTYNDHKLHYLRNYKFNICPENSNTTGYVTEKLFQSIEAGCIPIYWGSDNKPETEIINQDAVMFWKNEGDNTKLLEEIRKLNNSPTLLNEFIAQPRLLPNAHEVINKMYNDLEMRLHTILST